MPEAAGQRFALVDGSYWFKELGEWLHEGYGADYNVAHTELPKFLFWFIALFRSDVATIYKKWGMNIQIENSSTKQVLGIEFKDIKTSTLEMAESLINSGYIPDKRKK